MNVQDFEFSGIKGDMDCDRRLDVFDFTIGRKALVKSTELKGLAASNADIDSNGEIGIADMVRLQKYLLGMTKTL